MQKEQRHKEDARSAVSVAPPANCERVLDMGLLAHSSRQGNGQEEAVRCSEWLSLNACQEHWGRELDLRMHKRGVKVLWFDTA